MGKVKNTRDVLYVLDYYRMPYTLKKVDEDVATWDGEKLWVGMLDTNRPDFLLHELAHWLISSRRNLPNYGLGQSPDGGPDTKLSLSKEKAQLEEGRAALLGVIICGCVGLDVVEAADEVYLYSVLSSPTWGPPEFTDVWETLKKDYHWLKNKGILSLIPGPVSRFFKQAVSGFFHKDAS